MSLGRGTAAPGSVSFPGRRDCGPDCVVDKGESVPDDDRCVPAAG